MPEAAQPEPQSVPGMVRMTSTRRSVLEYVKTRSSVDSPSGSTTGVLTAARAPLVPEEGGEFGQRGVEIVARRPDWN